MVHQIPVPCRITVIHNIEYLPYRTGTYVELFGSKVYKFVLHIVIYFSFRLVMQALDGDQKIAHAVTLPLAFKVSQ